MSQLKFKKILVNKCTKHAKSVHAFVMREALPIPYITHAYGALHKNTPLNNDHFT